MNPGNKEKRPKDRNKSRHRPGYFTEYMRAYRARKAGDAPEPVKTNGLGSKGNTEHLNLKTPIKVGKKHPNKDNRNA